MCSQTARFGAIAKLRLQTQAFQSISISDFDEQTVVFQQQILTTNGLLPDESVPEKREKKNALLLYARPSNVERKVHS